MVVDARDRVSSVLYSSRENICARLDVVWRRSLDLVSHMRLPCYPLIKSHLLYLLTPPVTALFEYYYIALAHIYDRMHHMSTYVCGM